MQAGLTAGWLVGGETEGAGSDDDGGGLEIARTVCGGEWECGGGGSLALTTPITTG